LKLSSKSAKHLRNVLWIYVSLSVSAWIVSCAYELW